MAISAPVLIASDVGAGFPATLTVDAAAPAGTTLILKMALRDNGGGAETVVTVTDSASNTWVRTAFSASGTGITKAQLWRCSNNTALAISDTITISVSGAAATDRWAAEAYYVDGLDLTTPLDQSNSATGTSTAPSSGNITTTNADDIVLGAVGVAIADSDADPSQDTNSFLPSTGFFIESLSGGDTGASRQLIRGYRILTATGTLDYSPTLATSRLWVALVVSLKAAAGGGGGLSIAVAMHHYRMMMR